MLKKGEVIIPQSRAKIEEGKDGKLQTVQVKQKLSQFITPQQATLFWEIVENLVDNFRLRADYSMIMGVIDYLSHYYSWLLMYKVTEINGVKTYNMSAGKSYSQFI